MDSLTRTSRINYACAFGATSVLVYEIVLNQQYAIDFQGASALKALIVIASMIIYGLAFFPIFACLAIGSMFGFGLGTLYIWMMTAVDIYKLTECEMTQHERLYSVFSDLPTVLCLLYLSVSVPVRMVLAGIKGRYFRWSSDIEVNNTLEVIRKSYSGHHVMKLFRKVKVKDPPVGIVEKIKAALLNFVDVWVYRWKRGFRYPSRLLSVMLVSIIVVYMSTLLLLVKFVPLLTKVEEALVMIVDELSDVDKDYKNNPVYPVLLRIANLILDIMNTFKYSFIVGCTIATAFTFLNVLHMLSNYRTNLHALYRGDHTQIPPASSRSNQSLVVGCIKYAGFQVAYVVWGYLITLIFLVLIGIIIGVIVVLFKYNFIDTLVISAIQSWWPVFVTGIGILILQLQLAKYCFLQQRGQYLALDNRGWFFIFTYFMFFYNTFLGLLSCFLRIVKGSFFGVLLICRLDSSTFPRKFESFDPGFNAYIGYMQLECSHTHPVAIVFIRLMMLNQKKAEQRREKYTKVDFDTSTDTLKMPDTYDDELARRRRKGARFNWHVTYTLLYNPQLRVMRKGYISLLRQAQELGVYVPISDTQADLNLEELSANIAAAKDKRAHPKKVVENGSDRSDVHL